MRRRTAQTTAASDATPKPPSSAGRAGSAPPRRVAVPPEPHDWLHLWGGLVLVVAVCIPPLLVNLGAADVRSDGEAAALLMSRETWQRQHEGRPLAWMIPSANGESVVETPPMTAWLHMASWWGLEPAVAGTDTLVWRARLVSVAMGLLALGATYWAGISIGGAGTGRLAALALGTTLLFIDQARVASSDVVLLGWATLAIAAGLWAMRPLRPIHGIGRRVVGWLIAGAAIGAAILTTGPIALLFVLPPLVAAIILTPRRRVDHAIGLLFAVILGIIITSPWYLYVLEQDPGAWERMSARYAPPEDLFLLTWSHTHVLVMLGPWLVWLIAALCQPFLRTARERRPLLIAWFWFVLLAIAFSIPASRHPRYFVPILPAAALMIALLGAYHARLASARQEAPGGNALRIIHWLLIAAATVAGPLFIALQGRLISEGRLENAELPGLGWPVALGLGVALLAVALIGTRWHFHWRPRLAAYATVAWMILASTVGFYAHAHSHRTVNPHRLAAFHVAGATADRRLVYLDRGRSDAEPDPAFLFYLGRVVPPITPDQLGDLADRRFAAVLVHRDPIGEEMIRSSGFMGWLDFTDHAADGLRLYRTAPFSARAARRTSL